MYDIFTLIELVESKPCLWDKTSDAYKNIIMRTNAWRDICLSLEPEFEGFDDKEKDKILNTITTKWNNTRDYFIKSLKTKSGQAQKKQYIYHKNLLFLLKTIKEDSTYSNIVNLSQDSDNDSRPGTSASQNPSNDSDNESRPNMSATSEPIATQGSAQYNTSASRIHPTTSLTQNRKKRLNPVDVEILKALQNHEPQQQYDFQDDDEAFLMSIFPSIKRISEDDRLEFRIEVMQLLRKYTNRVRASSFSSTTSSPLPPVYISINSPTNEATTSPPRSPLQIENEEQSIYYPSAPPTSQPTTHAPLLPPTSAPRMEIQIAAPPISPAEESLITIKDLFEQDFDHY